MSVDQNQNINFLPSDAEAKAQAGKGESKPQTDYTEPEQSVSVIGGGVAQEKEGEAPDFLTQRKLPSLAAPPSVRPPVLPASTEISSSSSDAAPALNQQTNRLTDQQTNDVGKPDEPAGSAAEKSEPAPAPLPEKNPLRRSWWSKLFSRRKREESVAPTSPTAETVPEPAIPEPLPAGPAAEALDVNLLSAEYAQTFVLKNRVAVAVWTAVVSVLAVVASYTGALAYQSRKMESLEAARNQNQAVSSVIVGYRELANEDELLRRKILALKFLLKKHISLKTFLEKFEAITIPEVTYLNIAVTAGGGVNLAARASDYTAAARQLAIFKTEVPWIADVVMSGARRTAMSESKEPRVSFDLALKVDESVFVAGGK